MAESASRRHADDTSRSTAEFSDADTVLELDGVTKEYGAETAVRDLSLSVREGELLTLLGPSGCGKTTTLRMLAGLERPTGGTIELDAQRVAGPDTFVAAEDREIGIVFQDFALFPHLSVAENVAFGLTDRDEDATAARVDEMLALVDMPEMGDRSVDQLSGGQQQRVAVARSLAPEPDILLLDEPFSNLDVRLRVEMREEVRRILKEAGVTAVSVTHDQEEALSISDRVAVLNDGCIEQVGDPEAVFEHPESRFVASFLGQAAFLSARVGSDTVDTAVGSYDRALLAGLTDGYQGAMVDVLVRPDDLRAAPVADATGAGNGTIVKRQYTGPSFIYHVELDNGDVVRCLHNHADNMAIAEPVAVSLVSDHALAWYPTE
ncbi:ABC transporter ATP-binding protein [Halobacterium salinarum]|uniref:ABC transporter ATP-binding protein n=1 Tax=Halobacterium salinarum TaxID=2242 RepID=UPI002554C3B9|nr:ABC transporter ATP-binding protein [Halobacterium salinarum]MDL0139665.1 ABC transporter ATP-binding protein [Halobacterium salinarum]